jgi:hypothetical protein
MMNLQGIDLQLFANPIGLTCLFNARVSRFVMVEDQPYVMCAVIRDAGLVFDHDKATYTAPLNRCGLLQIAKINRCVGLTDF